MKLGIGIPYYCNHPNCETSFKRLLKTLERQLDNNMRLLIYEDGQVSEWLHDKGVIEVVSDNINRGAAHARNIILSRLSTCDYILFLDSDDMVDCDFISKIMEVIDKGYDMILSQFKYNGKIIHYIERSNVAGICLRTNFIDGLKFDEEYIISEDTLFISKVYERDPKIFITDSVYYYNYGINPNSLMMRFERSEIGLKRS